MLVDTPEWSFGVSTKLPCFGSNLDDYLSILFYLISYTLFLLFYLISYTLFLLFYLVVILFYFFV